jgi:Fic family protein
LFAFIDSGALLPDAEELKSCLQDVFALLSNDKIHPITRGFLFYYVMHATQPFSEENETVAILGVHCFLKQNGYSLLGLLNLEHHVFFSEKFRLQTSHLFDEHNYLELLDADLSGFLETCIHRFRAHVEEVKNVVIGVVKELFGYPDFTPRQKNVLNFWLRKGFFIQHQKLHDLSPRQHDIMMLLVKYGSVTNKDLVPIFQVDRKTLQRDFTTLLDLGLIEQRGMGRAVKYYVDFRIPLG